MLAVMASIVIAYIRMRYGKKQRYSAVQLDTRETKSDNPIAAETAASDTGLGPFFH